MRSIVSRLRGLVITALILAFCVPGFVALDAVQAPPALAANLNLDAPVISSVTSPQGDQLTVNFSAPTNPNSVAITGYQVEHSTDGTTWTTDTSALTFGSTNYTISALTPNTKYFVRVAATSATGLGSYGYPWTKIYATSATQRNLYTSEIDYQAGFGLGANDAAALNSSSSYSRIRYRMQATYDGTANYVDANFEKEMSWMAQGSEAFTTSSNLDYLRIPNATGAAANQFEIHGDVSDLTVLSNVADVQNGSGFHGRLEIWPWNYGQDPKTGLSSTEANNSAVSYDDGDSWVTGSGAYGSFQLHRLSSVSSQRKTIFAWNNHGSGLASEVGFGTLSGNTHPDWTFCSSQGAICGNRSAFSLGIFINVASSTLNTIPISYALNGGSGTTPSTTSYTANTSVPLAASTGITKVGYAFAGWNNGTTTYGAGTNYNVGVTPVTMTAQWTSNLVMDYDVTDTNSYTSGTTLSNRNSTYPNATLTSSSMFNRSTQKLDFGGGTYATTGSLNTSIFSGGLTVDVYGTLGSDSSSSWERFIDFAHAKGTGYGDASYNLQVGRYDNTNRIQLEIFNQNTGTGSSGLCASVSNQLDANFHRYTFVINGSTCSLYVDGTQVNVVNTASLATGLTIPYGVPLSTTWDLNYIGKSNWGHLGDAATSGNVRSLRIFKGGITPSNIDLVDSGRLVYKTVNYSSTETTTSMPAADVTTGTLALPLASAATRSGYTLANWYTTNARNVVAAAPGNGYLVPSSPITLYAGWTGSTNNVTWDVQGGTPTITGTTFVTGGTIASAPSTSPTRNDYVFAGWVSTVGGTPLVFPYSPPDLTSITLYAKWTLLTTSQSAFSITSTSGQFGTSLTLITTGGTGTGAISYTVSNGTANGCQVVAGVLSATSAGTCVVTAMKASDNTYLSTTTAATQITFGTKSVSVSAGSSTINYGGSFTNSYTAGQLAGSDAIATVSYTYTGTGGTSYGPSTTAPTAPGTYSITPTVTSMSTGLTSNYNFGYSAGTLTINAITLTAPGTVTAAVNTGVAKSLLLTWTSVANATNYTIKVSSGGTQVFTIDFSGTSATLTDARLGNGVTYDINVRANGTGNYSSSLFSSATGTATTATARTITYVYNGADGGNSQANASYIAGGTPISLPTPTQTNYSFAGWYSDSGFTAQVTGTQTPVSDTTLYAKWNANAYSLNFNPNYGAGSASTINVNIGNTTTLPTPSRPNFVFDGWWTLSTGGTKVGNGGATYTPTQTRTLYARWIQASLFGIAPGNLSRIGTLTANDLATGQHTASIGSDAVSVTLPSATLPAGTVVNLDLITDTSYAQSLLTGTNSYILSIAVSWLALDETVPNTNVGKAVQMTISSPSIKAGAMVFSIQTGSVVLLGRAVVNGSVTVELTSDPSVYVVATVPDAPQTVVVTPGASTAVLTWTAPASNGGETITGYTVTLNTGATCVTALLTCTFNNLTSGTSYTATVVATNSIGNSSTATVTFTPSAPGVGGGGGGGSTIIPVVPVKPIVPEPPKEPAAPIKPTVIPVPIVKVIESVKENNVPVLNGNKIIDPVYFKPNSAKLDNADVAILQKLASSLKGKSGTLLVTGFVKFTNVSSKLMKKIATDRAIAVTKQLTKLGITVTIGYAGYGPNNTFTPKATDRKVELRWVPAK